MWRKANLEISPIRDYAQAVEREASITAIRGSDNIKPLGKRRNHGIRINRKVDGSIACILYATEVVTFKPDGDIVVRIDGWASQSSAHVISDILGSDFYLFDKKMWCMATHDNPESLMHFPIPTHGETTFRRTGGDHSYRLRIVNPIRLKVHRVNRKASNNVSHRYADFMAYVGRTFRLRAENERGMAKFNIIEFEEVFGAHKDSLSHPIRGLAKYPPALWVEDHYKCDKRFYAEFQALIDRYGDEDKTQDYYKALLWLVSGITHYRSAGWATAQDIMKALDIVIKFVHRGEVFEEIDAFGLRKKDTYGKFFRQDNDQSS